MRSPIAIVDVDRLDTWSRYRAGLCETCAANCCTMPLEVQLPDLVARLKANAPLNEVNRATLYGGGAEGYTDYPALSA